MLAGYRTKTPGSERPLALSALVAGNPLSVVLCGIASAVDKEVGRRRPMMHTSRVRAVWRPEKHGQELPKSIRRRKLEPYFSTKVQVSVHIKVGHFYTAYKRRAPTSSA
jgi:hypothetical protein